MIYTKITIDTAVEAIDILSYALNELGVEGIEVEDKLPLTEEEKREMFIDIMPEQTEAYDGRAKVSCYIPMEGAETAGVRNSGTEISAPPKLEISKLLQDIREELNRIEEFMDVGAKTITLERLDDSDWLYQWREYFKPFRLEDNIVIKPTWEPLKDRRPEDIVIEIDPGIAFGTGSHETTRLCIRQLKKYITKDTALLDVGCGSGILSIAALKLGAREALLVDIDALAVRVSGENCRQNHLPSAAFRIVQGDLIGDPAFSKALEHPYDIVAANILAEVIIPLSGVIGPMLTEKGIFISSGILKKQEQQVRQALIDNQFSILETSYMGDWVSFTARKV